MAKTINQRENTFKVKLRQQNSAPYTKSLNARNRTARTDIVVFDVTPDITESRNVEYKTMQPIHMPGQIFVYGSTNSRTFSLSAVKLVSRTVTEATENMRRVWNLRGWTMPHFGARSSTLKISDFRRTMEGLSGTEDDPYAPPNKRQQAQERVGQPPQVLLLSAYADVPDEVHAGSWTRSTPTNIHNVPVVIQSLSIPYPSDVDYIPTNTGQPFPRVMIIDIQLLETRAPREFSEGFSIQDYREGILRGF